MQQNYVTVLCWRSQQDVGHRLHSTVLCQPIRCVRSKPFSNRAQDRAYTRRIRPPRAGWYGAYKTGSFLCCT